jgi:hypothetical protein
VNAPDPTLLESHGRIYELQDKKVEIL